MARLRIRYFTEIAGRVYMLYRDEIWRGFRRAPSIEVGERRAWRFEYLPAPVSEGMDLLALVWLASYRGMVLRLPFEEARSRVERRFSGGRARLRRGELAMLKRLAAAAETNVYALILSAAEALGLIKNVGLSKRRVAWLPSEVVEPAMRVKMHPLGYLFGRSALHYLICGGAGR